MIAYCNYTNTKWAIWGRWQYLGALQFDVLLDPWDVLLNFFWVKWPKAQKFFGYFKLFSVMNGKVRSLIIEKRWVELLFPEQVLENTSIAFLSKTHFLFGQMTEILIIFSAIWNLENPLCFNLHLKFTNNFIKSHQNNF